MAEELIPEPRDADDGDENQRQPKGRAAVVHVSLIARPTLSVDDPDLIDW